MRVLGLIPARGGSKGVLRKNLVVFAGKPLLVWTCEAALAASSLDAVVLSTDDPEIAACGEAAGVHVPFRRAAELAADDTPTLDVVRDALERLAAAGETYDAVCVLQPTNPLRRPEDIDAAVLQLEREGVDAVVSVAPVPHEHHPFWTYVLDDQGLLRKAVEGEVIPRRQELPQAWFREGSIYLVRTSVVLEQRSLYGERCSAYRIPAERSGGIDSMDDLVRLERQQAAR